MTGFGSSRTTPEPGGYTPPGEGQRRHGLLHLPLHLPHLSHIHLPHVHLPLADEYGEHSLLEALTHSLDVAGRGYCCAENPLAMGSKQAEDRPERFSGEEKHRGDTQRGVEDAKLSGK